MMLSSTLDRILTGDIVSISVLFITVILAVVIHRVISKKEEVALNPKEFQKFKLISKEEISHDTRRFTFSLQSPTTKLGLPIGQHISLRFIDKDGKGVQRSYTPVTGDENLGVLTFVIKVYKAGVHPKFPDGGKMSQHLDSLKIGDEVDMKGPKGHLTYKGKGKFTLKPLGKPEQQRVAKHFGMIAGGTGITPMLQIINAILEYKSTRDSSTTISLLYANQTEEDILVRSELEGILEKFPGRFQLHYTLDRPPQNWSGSTGFINKEMVEKYVLKNKNFDNTTQILMCGPPPMLKFACFPSLEALGFDESQWVAF